MRQPDPAWQRIWHPEQPISMLPTPEHLRARLLAAAEQGDVKAAWFLVTFADWMAHSK